MNPEIPEISQRLTGASLEERWDPFSKSIYQRLHEFAARGTAQSSMAVQAVGQICIDEARAAVQLAWRNLWRAALSVGIEPAKDLAAQLKAEVRKQTKEHFAKLQVTLRERERLTGIAVDHVHADLEKARELALAQVDAEIDMAAASVGRRAETQGGHTVYQFYAPVGAVMSGSQASASVVQNLGGQEKAELTAALERLLDAIAHTEEPPEQREELSELVLEARGELDKPKPNGLRVTSILEGVGHTVQTIGSLDAAYQALKAVAASVGIPLP